MLSRWLQLNHRFTTLKKILSPRVLIAVFLGICLHIFGYLAFRAVPKPILIKEESSPFVQYVSSQGLLEGSALDEHAVLFDSAPLFIPGQWNSAHKFEPPSRALPFSSFSAYEPEISFSEALLLDDLPSRQSYPVNSPVDLLAWRYWDLFRGFGGEVMDIQEFESTGSFMEVCFLNGEVLRVLPVRIDLVSMMAEQPAKYYLRIDESGRSIGRPALASSSGDVAFDGAAYTWIVESGLSAGLPAGLFKMSIYP